MKKHSLQLSQRDRKKEYKKVVTLQIGERVSYRQIESYVISVYPADSPLAGYLLIAGIGSPIKASQVTPLK